MSKVLVHSSAWAVRVTEIERQRPSAIQSKRRMLTPWTRVCTPGTHPGVDTWMEPGRFREFRAIRYLPGARLCEFCAPRWIHVLATGCRRPAAGISHANEAAFGKWQVEQSGGGGES